VPSNSIHIHAGLDVSKDWVDFFLLNGKNKLQGRRPRQASQLAELAAELAAQGCELAVIEATGGFERPLQAALEAAAVAVAVVNPKRVRDFARALGVGAKTDRIDAQMLALFGERTQPRPTPALNAAHGRFQQLSRQLAEFVADRARLRTRLYRIENSFLRNCLEQLIESFNSQIERIESEIERTLEHLPAVGRQVERLQSAPGVGIKTAWTLSAELPELGCVSGREATALTGLAPWARDSGAWKGRRAIGGGRARVRKALYMATLSCVRADGPLRDFYQRLLQKGKPKKLALIAVARKLLVALNAMTRDSSSWTLPQQRT
jgi:transposase